MRKTDLARLLARRPDGIFVSDVERGEIGPIYSELPALWALKACSPNAATGHSVWPAEAPDKGEEPEASCDEPSNGIDSLRPSLFRPIMSHVFILPFPLTSMAPRTSNSNWSLTRSYVSVETWILSGTPVDSIRDATFTVSPQTS
jgi:hypothetical protein